LQDVAEVAPELLERIKAWFRPYFKLRGWRDALWAVEWIGLCRVVASVEHAETDQGP
jgi:hypothetical protein